MTYPLLDTRFPTVDWARSVSSCRRPSSACLAALIAELPRLAGAVAAVAVRRGAGRDVAAPRSAARSSTAACRSTSAASSCRSSSTARRAPAARCSTRSTSSSSARSARRERRADLDLVFYLWTGPLSPCFGKDKMATFETYFVADKATQEEHKNPYFTLINDKAFCARILARVRRRPEQHGFIINGHVPVKLEAGETPVKKSGRAITIDGAFAAAYGDKGFSLVLDAASDLPRAAPPLRGRRGRGEPARRHRADGVGRRGLRRSRARSATPRPATDLRAEIAALEAARHARSRPTSFATDRGGDDDATRPADDR